MKRPLRWFLIVVGVLLVLAGTAYWLAHSRATETLERNDLIVAELIAELRARGGERPTLSGPALEGDAWDVYRAALDRIAKLDARDDEILDWLEGYKGTAEEPTQAEFDTWYAKTGQILTDLEGATRTPLLGAEREFQIESTAAAKGIPQWQQLSQILSQHVKRHRDRSEVGAALDGAVLVAYAGLDLMRHGSMLDHIVGVAITRIGLRQVADVLAQETVPPERLEQLAREAATLKAMRTDLENAWKAQELFQRQALADIDRWADMWSGTDADGAGLRYVYSNRVMAADALDALPRNQERLRTAAAGKTGENAVEAATQVFDEHISGDPNPLVADLGSLHPVVLGRSAELELHLDLLQVAVAIARYQAAHADLPEGFSELVPDYLPSVPICAWTGTPLRCVWGKVWSIGGDGVDDAGKPLGDDDGIGQPGDVVWEVRKPGEKSSEKSDAK